MKNSKHLIDGAFESFIAQADGNPRALLRLAELAVSRGEMERAIDLAQQASAGAVVDAELVASANEIIASTVPAFHIPMLRDQARNQAFENALIRAIKPDMRLLDVGAGSGLLAMIAARAGASAVYACEVNPAVAAVATDIVRLNGFERQIKVLAKHSKDLTLDEDLQGPVDVVVAEIFGKDLVDEFVLPSLRDVAERLLKPGGQMIPERGDIRIAPAWLDDLADRQFQVECGFDMTPFNRLLPQRIALGGKVKGLELRGDAVSLFSFDLRSTQAADTRVEVDLLADRGPVNGVVQWIGLKLDEAEYYENRPDPGSWSHWACQFLPLAQTIESTGEKAIRIAGSHKDGRLRLWQV